jgi:hypothetical protein
MLQYSGTAFFSIQRPINAPDVPFYNNKDRGGGSIFNFLARGRSIRRLRLSSMSHISIYRDEIAFGIAAASRRRRRRRRRLNSRVQSPLGFKAPPSSGFPDTVTNCTGSGSEMFLLGIETVAS